MIGGVGVSVVQATRAGTEEEGSMACGSCSGDVCAVGAEATGESGGAGEAGGVGANGLGIPWSMGERSKKWVQLSLVKSSRQ